MNDQKINDKKQYVSLPFFGLPKVAKFLYKYRAWMIIMITCGLLGSAGDIVIPLFQK